MFKRIELFSHRRLFSIGVVAVFMYFSSGLGTPVFAQSGPALKESFPKIAGYNIGAKNYDDPEYQARLAKLDWVILDFYRGWNRSGQSIGDVVSRLKSENPNLIVSQYVTIASSYEHSPSQPEGDLTEKLNSESGPAGNGDWWAYDANGNKLGWQAEGRLKVNYSTYVRPDSNGDSWPQYRAKRDKRAFFDNADFDVVFIDNFRDTDWVNSGRPDLNRDGVADDSASRDALYREAQAGFVKTLRSLMPDKLIVANATTWATERDEKTPVEYDQILDGGLLEHVMGMSWSVEGSDADGNVNGWGSWERLMSAYRKTMNSTKGKLTLFNMRGYTNDYKFMRYGLTSCLMDDGYFDYTDHNDIYDGVAWFDEYDVELGKAVTLPQMSPWQNGVYRRDFENGIALVNPRGNGKQTIRLEPGFRHFQGVQDPVRNNGQRVDSLVLDDADGVILLKEVADVAPESSKPLPPTLFDQ